MIAKSGHTDPDPWSILDRVTGDRKFKEKLEYTGIWWLPDKPEEQLCGAIRFTPGIRAELRLIGRFKDAIEKIIIGILSNGEYVTLYGLNRCEGAGTDISSGFQQYRCYADIIIVGHHFQKPEHIKFESIRIRYSHLDEWVTVSGFYEPRLDEPDDEIKYKMPEPIQASVGDGYKVSIRFERQSLRSPPFSAPKKLCIKERTYIEIEASEEKPFEEYTKAMRKIQHFLSLGVMAPVYPLTIDGVIKTNEKGTIHPTVEIYHWDVLKDIPRMPEQLWFDKLFTLEDISDRFDTFLKNWFKVADSLEPTVNLYFATVYTPDMYLDFHFLSLIQAIESFHRCICVGKYLVGEKYLFSWDDVTGKDNERLRRFLIDELGVEWVENAEIHKPNGSKTIRISDCGNSAKIKISNEKREATLTIRGSKTPHHLTVKEENGKLNIYYGYYEKKVRYDLEYAIPECIGKDHEQSLKSRIQYGNEFSLRTRLKEIFEEYKENLKEFIENKNTFVNEVVDTRNYLTHYEEDPTKNVASGDALYELVKKLRILMGICLLSELGFSSEEIKNIPKRNRRYRTESIQ